MDNAQVTLLRAFWAGALFTEAAEEFRDSSALSDYHANETFNFLIRCYQASERKYHNLNHLEFLFKIETPGVWSDRDLLIRTLFFFFHDCVYQIDPSNPVTDNEHRSAVEAMVRMQQMGFMKDESIIKFVCDTTELSNHTSTTSDPLQQFLLDCDLAILAAEPDEYTSYVHNVRNEYGLVPQSTWVQKRGDFLKYMLNKKSIFQNPHFITHYEKKAIKNMENELISLGFTR